ncbi:helix-turn-helix domain-containing protein [Rahnella aquatilis]|nr:helix-turn-helix domain-containing protein [Rahnella aquatilis]
MSNKLQGLVWDACAPAGLSISQVAIMSRLADYSNDDGISWPAIPRIARQVGAKSQNTVRSALKVLEAGGWLKIQERKVKGRNTSHIFRLNVAKLIKAAAEANADYIPSNFEVSNSEVSKIEDSNSEGSNNKAVEAVSPSNFEADPQVTTTPDPQGNKTLSPAATQPDDSTDENFLVLHPEAVVFSAKKRKWGSADDLKAAEWMWKKISKMYEKAAECDGEITRPKEPDWVLWANEIRLMHAADGRTYKQICELFSRANHDTFWCKNILSPSKLREKWDDLTIKLNANVPADTSAGGHWNSAEAWENTL